METYTKEEVKQFSESKPFNKSLKTLLEKMERLEQGKTEKQYVDSLLELNFCECGREIPKDNYGQPKIVNEKQVCYQCFDNHKRKLAIIQKKNRMAEICKEIVEKHDGSFKHDYPNNTFRTVYKYNDREYVIQVSLDYSEHIYISVLGFYSIFKRTRKTLNAPKLPEKIVDGVNAVRAKLKANLDEKILKSKYKTNSHQEILAAFPNATDIWKDSYMDHHGRNHEYRDSWAFSVIIGKSKYKFGYDSTQKVFSIRSHIGFCSAEKLKIIIGEIEKILK